MPAPVTVTRTSYEQWSKTFFDPAVTSSETFIVAHDQHESLRRAFGKADGAFWFDVTLESLADELDFAVRFLTWKASTHGQNHRLTVNAPPPTCGTPTTLACPPDDLLVGKREYLRDLLASAGATAADLAAAEARVDELIADALDNLILAAELQYR